MKRTVHNAIMTRKHLVKSAVDYAACAQAVTNINILFISSDVIESHRTVLDAIWNAAVAIPATQSIHCVRTVDVGIVTLGKYTRQLNPQLHILMQGPPRDSPAEEIRSLNQRPTEKTTLNPESFVAIPVPTDRDRTVRLRHYRQPTAN